MDCCGLRDGRRGLPLRIYMKYALDPRSARCRVVNRERTTRSDATAADQEAMPPRACTLAEFSCGPAGSGARLTLALV